VFLFRAIRQDKLDQVPMTTVYAKVLAKSVNVSGNRYNTSTSYSLAFETPNGARISLEVDQATYNTLLEGEAGSLSYKVAGRYAQFYGFVRGRPWSRIIT